MSDMEEAERKLRAAGFSDFIWGTTPVSPDLAKALFRVDTVITPVVDAKSCQIILDALASAEASTCA